MTSMPRPTDVVIRPFRAEDLPALSAWLSDAGLGVPIQVVPVSLARRLLEDGRIRVWTATRSGPSGDLVEPVERPAGFVRLDLAPDRTAELTMIVAADERRRGLGRALLDHAVHEARKRGLRKLIAVVATDNDAGRAFFGECGFEPSGTAIPGFDHLERYVHRSDLQTPLEIVP